MPRRGWSNPHLQTVRSRIRPIKVQLPPPTRSSSTCQTAVGTGWPCKSMRQTRRSRWSSSCTVWVEPRNPTTSGSRPPGCSRRVSGGPGRSSGCRDVRGGFCGQLSRRSDRGSARCRGHSRSAQRRGRVLLGANATIKLLGEHSPAVVAGVAVSALLDLAVGAEHLHHIAGGWYERFLLRRLRAESLRPAARYTPEERAAILSAKSIVDFDNAITAPRNGWRDAAEYYRVNSAIRYLDSVQQPLLMIHAKDDPMIPLGPYESVDWNAFPAVRLVLTEHGGHVGFHGRDDAPGMWERSSSSSGRLCLQIQTQVGDHRTQGDLGVEHVLAPR